MAPSLDCTLEALPHEIKLVIVAHLSPHVSSPLTTLRSHAYLVGLCRSSPSLYRDLESVLNSSISITERAQFSRLVNVVSGRVRNQVRSARLGRVTPPWQTAEIDLLAQSLPQLTELKIQGGNDGNQRELLEFLRGLPLERLEVEFGPSHPSPRRTRSVQQTQATLPWNARADSPLAVPGDADARKPVLVRTDETIASVALAGRSISDGPCTCLSLKLRAYRDVTCCYCCRCECVCCVVRAGLEVLPSLRELCLAGVSPRVASAPGVPCDWSLSSSIRSTASARLRTLRLEDCSFSADDFARILARPLDRLELLHCTDIDARALADAILLSGVELRHLGIDTTMPASRSPRASPQSSPTLSSRSTSTSPTDSLVGALLPHLASLTSLHIVGDALDKVDLADLARHLPDLRSLHLGSNPHISLADLAPLLSPVHPSHLSRLSRLRFEPPLSASLVDPCGDPSAEVQQCNTAVVEHLWRAAMAANVELAGAPFREVLDRFDWAAREVAKMRSCEDGASNNSGSPVRRRKRPSLASAES